MPTTFFGRLREALTAASIEQDRQARVEIRAWAKGSARNAGPQRGAGTVTVHASSGIDWPAIQLHACGGKMRRCDDCGVWVCEAPGHLRHVCEVRR